MGRRRVRLDADPAAKVIAEQAALGRCLSHEDGVFMLPGEAPLGGKHANAAVVVATLRLRWVRLFPITLSAFAARALPRLAGITCTRCALLGANTP
jgi:hypothetical protein